MGEVYWGGGGGGGSQWGVDRPHLQPNPPKTKNFLMLLFGRQDVLVAVPTDLDLGHPTPAHRYVNFLHCIPLKMYIFSLKSDDKYHKYINKIYILYIVYIGIRTGLGGKDDVHILRSARYVVVVFWT